MPTIIAIALFIILCPTISYLLVKRTVCPWNGGASLLFEDGTSAAYQKGNLLIAPKGQAVIGLFLHGADIMMMPQVTLDELDEGAEKLYFQSTPMGVNVMFAKPVCDNREIKYSHYFEIKSRFPLKMAEYDYDGYRNDTNRRYHYSLQLHFQWENF